MLFRAVSSTSCVCASLSVDVLQVFCLRFYIRCVFSCCFRIVILLSAEIYVVGYFLFAIRFYFVLCWLYNTCLLVVGIGLFFG